MLRLCAANQVNKPYAVGQQQWELMGRFIPQCIELREVQWLTTASLHSVQSVGARDDDGVVSTPRRSVDRLTPAQFLRRAIASHRQLLESTARVETDELSVRRPERQVSILRAPQSTCVHRADCLHPDDGPA